MARNSISTVVSKSEWFTATQCYNEIKPMKYFIVVELRLGSNPKLPNLRIPHEQLLLLKISKNTKNIKKRKN